MRRKFRTAVIATVLAVAFTVTAISLPSFLAAENLTLSSSTAINFQVFPPAEEQKKELDGLGLNCTVNEDGSVTLDSTGVGELSGTAMKAQHDDLIAKKMLRYAIYDGAICQQTAGLIIILDFTNYNITEFKGGFLKALTYAILGSNQLGNTGKRFKETNQAGGTLTIYDSSNGGAVITDPVTLTLQGIYNNNGLIKLSNSYVTRNGVKTELTKYSIRLILPRNPKAPAILRDDSLTLKGVEIGNFSPKQPDCIGLGISHLDIDPKNHASSIKIEPQATDRMHFHWLTTTRSQMEFALLRSLNNMLGINGASVNSGYVDEIFIKPNVLTDFSHLYLRSEKFSDGATISVYDSPNASVSASQNTAAAIRLFYWFERVYGLKAQNVNNVNLKFYRYQRSTDNTISATYSVLSCDTDTKYTNIGETCYAVYEKSDNGAGASAIIGYFSESGKLYNSEWKPTAA